MPEKKPFDLKELKDRLEAAGVPLAEDVLQKLTKEVFAWVNDGCVAKGGLYLVAVPILPVLAAEVDKLEDQIDGKVGV